MNSLFVIFAEKHFDTWMFDDPSRELIEEPFVLGTSEAIDFIINDEKCTRCRITHSTQPFPRYDAKAIKLDEDMGGYWYCLVSPEDMDLEVDYFWLCPATKAFYCDHPETIYVKIDKLN